MYVTLIVVFDVTNTMPVNLLRIAWGSIQRRKWLMDIFKSTLIKYYGSVVKVLVTVSVMIVYDIPSVFMNMIQ